MQQLYVPALLSLLLTWAPSVPASGQHEETLFPSKDNTLYESDTSAFSNGAGAHLFAGRTNRGEIRRALLAFDVADVVPAGATIDSVQLTLHMSMTITGAQAVSLHPILADWGEGAADAPNNEGAGTDAAGGDATWLHTFADTSFWDEAGGDFSATASASQAVGGPGPYTWGSTPEMVADVQQWLDDPGSNFGWMLVGNEATSPTAKRFGSRENPDESVRPALRVFYSTPSTRREDPAFPTAARLAQNYPNPFRTATTITYSVEVAGKIELAVYDLLGHRVAKLVDAWTPPGTYHVPFEAGRLPSGRYTYRLSAGGSTQQRTLVVLK